MRGGRFQGANLTHADLRDADLRGSDLRAASLQGADLRDSYPKGADPIVLGESANTITTYGYDPATGMQEPKVTLCQIRSA